MIIQCPQCLTKFKMDDSKVKDEGTKVRCAKCKEVFVVTKDAPASEPQAATPAAPQPGQQEVDFSAGTPSSESDEFVPPPVDFSGIQMEGTSFDSGYEEKPSSDFGTVDTGAKGHAGVGEDTGFGEDTSPSFDSGYEEKPSSDFGTVDTGSKGYAGVDEDTSFGEDYSAAGYAGAGADAGAGQDIGVRGDYGVAGDSDFGGAGEGTGSPAEEKGGGFDLGGMSYGEVDLSSSAPSDESFQKIEGDFGGFEAKVDEPPFGGFEPSGEEPAEPAFGSFEFKEEPMPEPPQPSFGETEESAKTMVIPPSPTPPPPPSVKEESYYKAEEQPADTYGDFEREPLQEEMEQAPAKGRPNVRNLVIAVLAVIALAVPGWMYWQKQSSQETGVISVTDLNGYFAQNAQSGNIFVIEGKAVNNTNKSRSFFQVRGTLFGKKGEKLVDKVVYCGTTFSPKEISVLSKEKINSELTLNKVGSKLSNINISPGKYVPFMIIFFDLPQEMGEFSAEVTGSELASE